MNARVTCGLWRTAVELLAVAVVVLSLCRVALAGTEAAAPAPPAPPAPPARLSDTGLYAADGTVAAGNLPFLPQYPLWTDGADKARWIHLPEGARIDVGDIDAWRFPVGTKLWKEFAWGGHKVETRLLWLAEPDSWVFATYVWNDAQTDAELAPDEGVPGAYEFAAGRRHSIPGRNDCVTCHGTGPAAVLGFSALQLSDDRDPLAPHSAPLPAGAVTLRSLVAADRLAPPRPELVAAPPRIRTDDPVERAALGYLSTNCGACHNSTGSLARLGLDFRHDAGGAPGSPEPAVTTAVDASGNWTVPGVAADSSRVVAPGSPSHSAVVYRMNSRRPSSQMPPLGSVVRDDEAVALIREWVSGLKGGAPVRVSRGGSAAGSR